MNIYRLAMISIGSLILLANLAYVLAFRPGIRKWNIGLSIRFDKGALMLVGFWLIRIYYLNPHAGRGTPNGEKVQTVLIVAAVAVASVVSFGMYLRYRTWGPGTGRRVKDENPANDRR